MKLQLKRMEIQEQRQHGKPAPLKTDYSYAVLPIGSFVVDKYRAHMARRRAAPSTAGPRGRVQSGGRARPEGYEALVTVNRHGTPVRHATLSTAFKAAKAAARARGVMVPETATFRHLRDFMDAVLIASGVPPRSVQIRMRHGTLAMTLDTYGFALEVDWENAPASFEELFGIPAPPGLPEAAPVPRAERVPPSDTAPVES
ncbi:tyrosine-type recombinase/integrase [Streptomyces sp. MBT65]|nr:tyrosine-type recombinase/integrase [Streptomyces sp. MBT65]